MPGVIPNSPTHRFRFKKFPTSGKTVTSAKSNPETKSQRNVQELRTQRAVSKSLIPTSKLRSDAYDINGLIDIPNPQTTHNEPNNIEKSTKRSLIGRRKRSTSPNNNGLSSSSQNSVSTKSRSSLRGRSLRKNWSPSKLLRRSVSRSPSSSLIRLESVESRQNSTDNDLSEEFSSRVNISPVQLFQNKDTSDIPEKEKKPQQKRSVSVDSATRVSYYNRNSYYNNYSQETPQQSGTRRTRTSSPPSILRKHSRFSNNNNNNKSVRIKEDKEREELLTQTVKTSVSNEYIPVILPPPSKLKPQPHRTVSSSVTPIKSNISSKNNMRRYQSSSRESNTTITTSASTNTSRSASISPSHDNVDDNMSRDSSTVRQRIELFEKNIVNNSSFSPPEIQQTFTDKTTNTSSTVGFSNVVDKQKKDTMEPEVNNRYMPICEEEEEDLLKSPNLPRNVMVQQQEETHNMSSGVVNDNNRSPSIPKGTVKQTIELMKQRNLHQMSRGGQFLNYSDIAGDNDYQSLLSDISSITNPTYHRQNNNAKHGEGVVATENLVQTENFLSLLERVESRKKGNKDKFLNIIQEYESGNIKSDHEFLDSLKEVLIDSNSEPRDYDMDENDVSPVVKPNNQSIHPRTTSIGQNNPNTKETQLNNSRNNSANNNSSTNEQRSRQNGAQQTNDNVRNNKSIQKVGKQEDDADSASTSFRDFNLGNSRITQFSNTSGATNNTVSIGGCVSSTPMHRRRRRSPVSSQSSHNILSANNKKTTTTTAFTSNVVNKTSPPETPKPSTKNFSKLINQPSSFRSDKSSFDDVPDDEKCQDQCWNTSGTSKPAPAFNPFEKNHTTKSSQKQQQQQKPQMKKPSLNPFEKETPLVSKQHNKSSNPFDTESPVTQQQPQKQRSKMSSSNPFDNDSPQQREQQARKSSNPFGGDSPLQQQQQSQQQVSKKSSNPFDNDSSPPYQKPLQPYQKRINSLKPPVNTRSSYQRNQLAGKSSNPFDNESSLTQQAREPSRTKESSNPFDNDSPQQYNKQGVGKSSSNPFDDNSQQQRQKKVSSNPFENDSPHQPQTRSNNNKTVQPQNVASSVQKLDSQSTTLTTFFSNLDDVNTTITFTSDSTWSDHNPPNEPQENDTRHNKAAAAQIENKTSPPTSNIPPLKPPKSPHSNAVQTRSPNNNTGAHHSHHPPIDALSFSSADTITQKSMYTVGSMETEKCGCDTNNCDLFMEPVAMHPSIRDCVQNFGVSLGGNPASNTSHPMMKKKIQTQQRVDDSFKKRQLKKIASKSRQQMNHQGKVFSLQSASTLSTLSSASSTVSNDSSFKDKLAFYNSHSKNSLQKQQILRPHSTGRSIVRPDPLSIHVQNQMFVRAYSTGRNRRPEYDLDKIPYKDKPWMKDTTPNQQETTWLERALFQNKPTATTSQDKQNKPSNDRIMRVDDLLLSSFDDEDEVDEEDNPTEVIKPPNPSPEILQKKQSHKIMISETTTDASVSRSTVVTRLNNSNRPLNRSISPWKRKRAQKGFKPSKNNDRHNMVSNSTTTLDTFLGKHQNTQPATKPTSLKSLSSATTLSRQQSPAKKSRILQNFKSSKSDVGVSTTSSQTKKGVRSKSSRILASSKSVLDGILRSRSPRKKQNQQTSSSSFQQSNNSSRRSRSVSWRDEELLLR